MDSAKFLLPGGYTPTRTKPILPDIPINSLDSKIISNSGEIDPGGKKEEVAKKKVCTEEKSTSHVVTSSPTPQTRFIDSSVPQLKSMIPMKMLPFNQFSSLTVTPPFVLKLCSMLSTKEFEYLITWGANEDTVLVKDLIQFSAVVLPKYFKHRNFTSFLRQLNMYGFHTLRQGENWREFKNDLFRKDASQNYDKIKRKTPQTNTTTKITLDSRSSTFKSSQHTNGKDSRKRKKDVFKRKSEKEQKDLFKKQGERIEQLLRRCEANEERIEALEEELLSVKSQLSNIKKESSEKSEDMKTNNENEIQSSEEDQDMRAVESASGQEYGKSLAFAQIEGRQRTLSDSCLSNFTLSALQQPTTQMSNSFQPNIFENQHQGRHQTGSHPWYWRKNSFDEMSLSFGGFNLGSNLKGQKNSSKKSGKTNKTNNKKKASTVPSSRMYIKNDKVKRKKKALKTSQN